MYFTALSGLTDKSLVHGIIIIIISPFVLLEFISDLIPPVSDNLA